MSNTYTHIVTEHEKTIAKDANTSLIAMVKWGNDVKVHYRRTDSGFSICSVDAGMIGEYNVAANAEWKNLSEGECTAVICAMVAIGAEHFFYGQDKIVLVNFKHPEKKPISKKKIAFWAGAAALVVGGIYAATRD